MRLLVPVLLLSSLAVADDRVPRLSRFMESYGCRHDLASLYVKVADRHGLDYRLLPAISVVESSCGRFMRANNLFGWNSGRSQFKTASEAVEVVSRKIAGWKLDTKGVLKRYNPSREYLVKVVTWMTRIDDIYRHEFPVVEGTRCSNSSSDDDPSRNVQDQGSFGVLLACASRIQTCAVIMERGLQFSNWSYSELP